MPHEDDTTSVPSFTLRTPGEILARLKDQEDIFGFRCEVLVTSLPFEEAREFLKEDTTAENWDTELTRDAVLKEMLEYLDFAWDKALSHRGLSAGRSIQKLTEWLWILGDEEAVSFVSDDTNYLNYGAPALLYISNRYGVACPGTSAAVNMAAGLPCEPGCEMGCCE